MITKKAIKVPASQIPSGTTYLLASFENNLEYTLNSVRLNKGVAKIVRSAGDQEFRGIVEVRSSLGNRAIADPDPRNSCFDVWSPSSGTRMSREKVLFKGYDHYSRHSFSSQERYLAFTWQRYDTSEKLFRVGIGVYDCVTQRIWEQANAMFAAWSVSGSFLIFAGWDISGADSIKNLRFFRKSVGFLSYPLGSKNIVNSAAEPISPALAERLVGKWYFPLMQQALTSPSTITSTDLGLANLTGHNSIAPGNRGVILTESRNKNYDPNFPIYPYDQDLEWSSTFIDEQGRHIRYEPSPPLFPIIAWSRDAERLYGITRPSFSFRADGDALICFWVRSGKYAVVPFSRTLGSLLTYVEN